MRIPIQGPELPFREVWLIDFEFVAPAGERQRPVCLVAEELWTGRQLRLWEDDMAALTAAPFDTGPNSATVAYFASAEMGCFEALGWPHPMNIIDLFAEFRVVANGRKLPRGRGLLGAAAYYGVQSIEAEEKETMRELIMGGGPWTEDEREQILDYCASDVTLLRPLLIAMAPEFAATPTRLGHAVWRGRYMSAVAAMEDRGIPIDLPTLTMMRDRWDDIKGDMIANVDADFGVYDGLTFKAARFEEYLKQHKIWWPRLETGALALDDDTFKDQARANPILQPLRELRHALGEMRLNSLAVGPDGRNRTLLSPFRSKTGRNQPSNSKFVFGAATWVRGLIKPAEGMAVAYLDFSSQEHAIAGALSGDKQLWSAYQSGDPYLQFAKDAKLVPQSATKASHEMERDKCKAIVLGVSYGMSYHSMAHRAGIHVAEARELLQLHRETYHVFWSWAERNVDVALAGGTLTTAMGWQYRIGHAMEANPRSALNWPMQAGGAEILRLTCVALREAGIGLCAPVHDAVVIEAPLDRIDEDIARTTEIMQQSCRHVMRGKTCRVDADVIRFPDRFMDTKRGVKMWNAVMQSIGLPEYSTEKGAK